MLKEQGGCCAICGTNRSERAGEPINFSVDHCHTTGAIRGLLCNMCNRGLGFFGDNLEGIKKAVAYLEKAKGIKVGE